MNRALQPSLHEASIYDLPKQIMPDIDAHCERQLWATVLLCMTHDLIKSSHSDRTDAERWVGLYPSRDFQEVVTLAGLDPEAVFARLRRICGIPFSQRKSQLPYEFLSAGGSR